MNKINYKIYCRQDLLAVVFFFIVSVMIFAIIFTTNKVIPSIDFKTHYRWLTQYQAALAEGTLYPRWMPLSNLGLGELFYSAYPVYYYLASFLTFYGMEPWSSMKLLGAISNFLAGLITYYGLRIKFGWKTAFLVAIFVQLGPVPTLLSPEAI